MELYEQLGYTQYDLLIVRQGLEKCTKSVYHNLSNSGLESICNNILALSDIINKIDAGETVDTRFNLVDTRDNAVFLKEAEKQKAILYLETYIQSVKNL